MNSLNVLLENAWIFWIGTQFIQTLVATLLAFSLISFVRLASPNIKYAILVIVMLKFLISPVVSLPTIEIPNINSGSAQSPPMQTIYYPEQISASLATISPEPQTPLRQTTLASKPPVATSQSSLMAILLNWKTGTIGAYGLGVVALLGISIRRMIQLRGVLRRSSKLPNHSDLDIFAPARQCKLARSPSIRVSIESNTPFATGIFRPTVVLPSWATTELSTVELSCVIAHEMIHHRRFDLWFAAIQNLTTIVWWFHPCVWLLNRKIRQIREECCDDAVIASGAVRQCDYAQTLISASRVAKKLIGVQPWTPRTAMALGSQSSRRIRRSLSDSRRVDRLGWKATLAMVLLAIPIVPCLSFAQSGEPKSPKPAPRPTASATTTHATIRIAGIVVDESGKPLPNAQITTYPRLPGEKSVETRTGNDGKFSLRIDPLPGLSSKNIHAAVYKRGYAVDAFSSAKQPIRVILKTPQTIAVQIHTPDGSPAIGTRIVPYNMQLDGLGAPPPEAWTDLLATPVDSDGNGAISATVRSQLLSIAVYSERWGRQQFALPQGFFGMANTEPFVAKLRPVGYVEATITNPAGIPVKGLDVICVTGDGGAFNAQLTRAQTDATGSVRMTLPRGRYQFLGTSPQRGSFEKVTFQIREGETAKIQVTTQSTRRVSGRVLTDLNTPAANIPVSIRLMADTRITATDAEGYFSFDLPPGQWSYQCFEGETAGYIRQQSNGPLTTTVTPDEDVSLPTIIVKTGHIISGEIRNVDTSVSRIRAVLAKVGTESYGTQYDASGLFQLTLPRSITAEDVDEFEVRFADEPVAVVSTSPLILELRPDEKPLLSERDQFKVEIRKMLKSSNPDGKQVVELVVEFLDRIEITPEDLRGGMQIIDFLGNLNAKVEAERLCDTLLERCPQSSDFEDVLTLLRGTKQRLTIVGSKYQFTGDNVLDGKSTNWSDYEGETVLIQVWATWCLHCKDDLQTAAELHNRYQDNGFTVIGVGTDQQGSLLRQSVVDNDFPWVTIHSPFSSSDGISHQLGITQIPYNLLIGPDGFVLATNLRHKALEKYVDSLMANTP